MAGARTLRHSSGAAHKRCGGELPQGRELGRGYIRAPRPAPHAHLAVQAGRSG